MPFKNILKLEKYRYYIFLEMLRKKKTIHSKEGIITISFTKKKNKSKPKHFPRIILQPRIIVHNQIIKKKN